MYSRETITIWHQTCSPEELESILVPLDRVEGVPTHVVAARERHVIPKVHNFRHTDIGNKQRRDALHICRERDTEREREREGDDFELGVCFCNFLIRTGDWAGVGLEM